MPQARTQTVSLGEHWNNLIDGLLKSGRYASVSENYARFFTFA